MSNPLLPIKSLGAGASAHAGFISAAPQIDIGLAAGFAVLFGVVSLASSNTAQGAEYQFGTHAAAIYESQFKGAIWGPAQAAAVTPKLLGAFVQVPEQAYTNAPSWVLASIRGATPQPIALSIAPPQTDPTQLAASVFRPLSAGQTPPQIGQLLAGPQSVDLTLEGDLFAPLVSPQGRPLTQFSVAPQADTTQPPALIIAAALAPLIPPSVPARLTSAAPQAIDLTIQGWIETPQLTQQGRAPPTLVASPQADPTQIPAAVFPRLRTPPIAPNPIAGMILTAPQFEERVTQAVLPSQRAGSVSLAATTLLASPQAVDLTIQGWIRAPQAAQQGRTPPFVVGIPQGDPAQIAAQLLPSLRTPPIAPNPIAGFVTTLPQFEERVTQIVYPSLRSGFTVRVPPILQGAPQFADLTIQGWTIAPTVVQGRVPPLSVGTPQTDPTQVPAQVFPSLRTPPVIPNPIAGLVVTLPQFEERVTQTIWPSVRAGFTIRVPQFTQGAPQLVDLTLQGWTLAPLTRQGPVPPIALGIPQADPTQVAPLVIASARTAAVIPNPIGGFVLTAPQFEERTTAIVYPSLRSGQTPPRIAQIAGTPQADPSQTPSKVFSPALAHLAPIGPVARVPVTLPQFEERPTSIIWASAVLGGALPPMVPRDRLTMLDPQDRRLRIIEMQTTRLVIEIDDTRLRFIREDDE